MKKVFFIAFTFALLNQTEAQTKHHRRHHKHHVAIAKHEDNKPTDMHNTGSSDGTMPDNKSVGKVTTSSKGKNGPKNGEVKKP